MPPPRVPPYGQAREQCGVLSRQQLREAGLSRAAVRSRVDSGELKPVTSGVFRLSGAPTNWSQRIWAALLAAPATAVASHRTAARLHGIGNFRQDEIDVVRVGDPPDSTTVGAAGHRSLLLPDHHRTKVDGIPTTTIERTIFDLAGQVSVKRLARGLPSLPRRMVERSLDDALARGLPITALEGVLHDIGGRGRGGTTLMRELLKQRSQGFVATESELEDLVCRTLAEHGLPLPERQRNLGNEERWIGRVDFVYPEHQTVIEADGRRHHTALLDQENDRWRDLELAAAGFVVVRVTWAQLTDEPARFVRQLERILKLRGWIPPNLK